MLNKNPNGPDKKLPSTEQELEQYGVWVKAEPQDVVEEPETEHAILDEIDSLDIDAIDLDESMDDTLLSIEEEQELNVLVEDTDFSVPDISEEMEISFDDDAIVADDFGLDELDSDLDSQPATAQTAPRASAEHYELASNSHYELEAKNPIEESDDFADFGIDDLDLEPENTKTVDEDLGESEFTLDEFEDDLEISDELSDQSLESLDEPTLIESPPSGMDDFTGLEALDEDDDDDIIDIPLDDLDYDAPIAAPSYEDESRQNGNGHSHQKNLETTEISLDEFGLGDEEAEILGTDSHDTGVKPRDIAKHADSESVVEYEDVSFDEPESSKPQDASEQEEMTDSSADDNFYEPIDLDLQFDDTIPSPEDSSRGEAIDFNPDDVEDLVDSSTSDDDFDADALLADVFGDDSAKEAPKAAKQVRNAEDVTLDFSAPEKGKFPMPSAFGDSADEAAGVHAASQTAESFDDLAAVEEDLGRSDKQPAAQPPIADTSSQLLLQIASELSSIKSELMSLRSQLKDIKAAPATPAEISEPGDFIDAAGTEEDQDAAKGGFFDDEDDETIALTGDELDNILNTADFTEETLIEESLGEEAPQLDELNLDTTFSDVPLTIVEAEEDTDLLPEDGDYAPVVDGIETIEFQEETAAAINESDADAIDTMDVVEEIVPMTEAPEDTSYLEHEIEAYPIDETPLEEPDLSEIDLADVLVEAEDDTTEELPLVNSLDADMPDPSSDAEIEELEFSEEDSFLEIEEDINFEDELRLDIDGDEENVEGLEYEPSSIPEIEDALELEEESDLQEIELHAEDFSPTMPEIEQSKTTISEPVQVHPDELSMSLDDSFFIDSAEQPSSEIDDFDLENIPETESTLLDEPETAATVPPATKESPREVEAAPLAPQAKDSKPDVVPELGIPAKPAVPDKLTHDIKSVLVYLDQLLSALPEEKIEEFASSEYYDTYKKLFEELGIL